MRSINWLFAAFVWLTAAASAQDLSERIGADVQQGFAQLEPGAAANRKQTVDALQRRFGSGPWLLGPLSKQFAHPWKGLLALELVGRLRDVTPNELADAVASVERTDRAFVIAAARALEQATPLTRMPEATRTWRRHRSLTLRLVGLEATRRTPSVIDEIAKGALASQDEQEVLAAVQWMKSVPNGGLGPLIAAVERGLPKAAQKEALQMLVAGPEIAFPVAVRAALADETLAASLSGMTFSDSRRRTLVAEILSQPESDAANRWLEQLEKVPTGAGRRAVLQRVFADPSYELALCSTARRLEPEGAPRHGAP